MAGWCSWLSRIVNTDKVAGSSPALVIRLLFVDYLVSFLFFLAYLFAGRLPRIVDSAGWLAREASVFSDDFVNGPVGMSCT